MVLPTLKAKQAHNKTAGISVVSRGIALAIVDHTSATPRLVHAQFYPCDLTDQTRVLGQISKDHQLDSVPCNFVLNPDEYQFLQVEKPEVDKHELQSALRWHIKDLIDYHIDDVVIDYLTLPVDSMPLQVIATRKSTIQSRVDLLHESKCQLQSIDIAAQAARNLLDSVKEIPKDTSVGILNLWDSSAKISVLLNHDIYINRVTQIGADVLTTVSVDDIDSQDVVDSLAIELQRTFDYYESFSRQIPVSHLVIMSNTRAIPNIDVLLHDRLGIECKVISSHALDDLAISSATNIEVPDVCLMAIGGALRAGA